MRFAFLTAALLVAACGGSDPEGETEEEAPERATVVEGARVTRGSVAASLSSTAVVEAKAMADLYPLASGVVLEVRREEGDPVRRGDVLAVLDVASLAAGNTRARAEVERQESEVARLTTLHQQGAVSSRELEEARHALTQSRTSAWEAGRTGASARITSPIDGVVALRDLRVGEVASSAKRAFQVVDLGEMRVVASLPERDLARVHVGQSVRLVSAYDPSLTTTGRVERVAPVVDSGTGTFRVTISVPVDQAALRPGQFVSVGIEVERHDDVLVIPRSAIVYEDGAPVVFRVVDAPPEPPPAEGDVVDADVAEPAPAEQANAADDEADAGPKLVAERVPVTLGIVDAEHAEILGGLDADDLVVVVGQANLRDGAVVRLPGEAAQPAPTPLAPEPG